jgi:hypothetical protein
LLLARQRCKIRLLVVALEPVLGEDADCVGNNPKVVDKEVVQVVQEEEEVEYYLIPGLKPTETYCKKQMGYPRALMQPEVAMIGAILLVSPPLIL